MIMKQNQKKAQEAMAKAEAIKPTQKKTKTTKSKFGQTEIWLQTIKVRHTTKNLKKFT